MSKSNLPLKKEKKTKYPITTLLQIYGELMGFDRLAQLYNIPQSLLSYLIVNDANIRKLLLEDFMEIYSRYLVHLSDFVEGYISELNLSYDQFNPSLYKDYFIFGYENTLYLIVHRIKEQFKVPIIGLDIIRTKSEPYQYDIIYIAKPSDYEFRIGTERDVKNFLGIVSYNRERSLRGLVDRILTLLVKFHPLPHKFNLKLDVLYTNNENTFTETYLFPLIPVKITRQKLYDFIKPSLTNRIAQIMLNQWYYPSKIRAIIYPLYHINEQLIDKVNRHVDTVVRINEEGRVKWKRKYYNMANKTK